MKVIKIWLLFQLIISGIYAQSGQFVPNEEYFKSVFARVVSGEFPATANGLLIVKNSAGKEVLLDFQGNSANLFLQEDPDSIYDVSWKKYSAYTTSGKTKVGYTTYAMANYLEITTGSQTFSLGGIDGACDSIINGLSYDYAAEKEAEYLILAVQKEIRLLAEDRKSHLLLLPNSTLVFAVKR
ncbi:MAG: hypothetical protein LUE98_15290 [Tannerellaceae bacterium]|nr:hypothetical protein [Tannerellaceae bacterium]